MAETQWYVGIAGEQRGPFPEDEVREMILRRELTARNHVWRDGMEAWAQLGDLDEFAETLAEAPPPPGSPLPGAEHVKGFFGDMAALVRDPDEGLTAVLDKKPVCFAVTWMALGTIVFALMAVVLAIQKDAQPLLLVGPGGGWTIFGRAILHAIILYGLSFGALMIAFGPVLKSPADWKDGLSLLGVSSIPTATLGLVLFGLLWIPSSLVDAFALAIVLPVAVPANVLFIYRTFIHVTRTSRRAAMIAVPAIYLGVHLAYVIIRLAMS